VEIIWFTNVDDSVFRYFQDSVVYTDE